MRGGVGRPGSDYEHGGTQSVSSKAETLACTCAHLADERKAEGITVLNVAKMAFFTDYFVIATGRNNRQIRAIAREVMSRMRALGQPVVGIEGEADSGWVLIDLGGAVVHLFSPAARGLYDLELLWGAAPRVAWEQSEPLPAGAVGEQ
jgi:ribosome-associated protein